MEEKKIEHITEHPIVKGCVSVIASACGMSDEIMSQWLELYAFVRANAHRMTMCASFEEMIRDG